MRKQEEGEPVDAFVTDLYALAEHCSFGALHDEMTPGSWTTVGEAIREAPARCGAYPRESYYAGAPS